MCLLNISTWSWETGQVYVCEASPPSEGDPQSLEACYHHYVVHSELHSRSA